MASVLNEIVMDREFEIILDKEYMPVNDVAKERANRSASIRSILANEGSLCCGR